jgi:hypothetical protein
MLDGRKFAPPRAFIEWPPSRAVFGALGHGFRCEMKEGFDKEIDSLLRRGTRGAGAEARVWDGGGAAPSSAPEHLDADELNAFAEGALPAASRLAAVSHLADCDECRGLVISLRGASGIGNDLETRAAAMLPETAQAAGWREWLASLFAPRVLRYAAPALALCLVAAVSFVALRSRHDNGRPAAQLAQNDGAHDNTPDTQESAGTSGNPQTANANVSIISNSTTNSAPRNLTTANTSANQSGKEMYAKDAPGGAAVSETKSVAADTPPPPAIAEAAGGVAASAPKPAPVETVEVAKTDKEKSARADAPIDEVTLNEQPQQTRLSNQARGMEPQMPDGARNQKRGEVNNASNSVGSRAGLAKDSPREGRDKAERGPGSAPARRARPSEDERARSDDDSNLRIEETRSAAGHRFRREGGAWVDVNYKSSMSSTGVRRGTDAYRALVADLPELGRVAEQLSGEVVVVLRGRAYRIR